MHREEIEPNEHKLVITSAPPQPEEKKNKGKRKKPVAGAENIPARITRSKVVNPANNTRSKKKIWIWTVNLNLNLNFYDEFELLSMFVLNSRACVWRSQVCMLNIVRYVASFLWSCPKFLSIAQFCPYIGSTKLVNGSGLALSWLKRWPIDPNLGTHMYLGLIHHMMLENLD